MAESGRTSDPLEDTSTWPAVAPPGPDEAASQAPAPELQPGSSAGAVPPSPPAAPPTWGAPPPGGLWPPRRDPWRPRDDNPGRILGLILIVVGVWLIARRYLDLDTELVLPIVVIAIGGMLLASGLRPRGRNG